jgi:hypothetical protein
MVLSVESFTLYNQNDEVVYTKEKPRTHTFCISDAGTVFALNEKQLYLYNQNGLEIFLKNLNYPNGFKFSPDNVLFFASDKDGIFVYSNEGALVYALNPGRLFSSTVKGKTIAIISTDTIFVYEHGVQKFVKKLATPYVRTLSFSEDETSIIIKEPAGVEVIDVQTGKRLGEE